MNRRILLVTVAIVAALAACSGGGSAASATPPSDADASITAEANAFEPRDVAIPDGQPFELFFKNLDGQPHNVAIYQDNSASEALFVGENVTDGTVIYHIPALPAGTWFFRCDVHPDMQGTIDAG